MLTKERAAVAAEELISQQRALSRQAPDARARRVSFLYLSRDLLKLAPAERAKAVQLAQPTVQRQKSVMAVSIAWVAICLSIWFMVWPATPASLPVLAVCGGLLLLLARTLMVRREVRRFIAAPQSVV